jgi:hypothetical protein
MEHTSSKFWQHPGACCPDRPTASAEFISRYEHFHIHLINDTLAEQQAEIGWSNTLQGFLSCKLQHQLASSHFVSSG